jgi:hypothetical protein
MIMYQYRDWEDLAKSVASDDLVFAGAWKQSDALRGILEHVSPQLGAQFLARIAEKYPAILPLTAELCRTNDEIGQTFCYDLGLSCPVGPTSVRYVFHACEVLSRAAELKAPAKIVEVGCGYGGLALIMSLLAPHFKVTIDAYCLYDLPQPQLLQQRYLAASAPRLPARFGSGDFGALLEGSGWILVSAYGIGEFSPDIADKYLAEIVPKTSGGFLVWNTPRQSPFLSTFSSEIEFPQTGVCNRVITW